MASNKNQNLKMIGLRFQLLVVFYLINGRYAYKEYLSDDANEYNHETGTNSSQINYNEPPGKSNNLYYHFEILCRLPHSN